VRCHGHDITESLFGGRIKALNLVLLGRVHDFVCFTGSLVTPLSVLSAADINGNEREYAGKQIEGNLDVIEYVQILYFIQNGGQQQQQSRCW
jgi:hypothetical protein